MNKPRDYFNELAKKWLSGEITNQEKAEFEEWYASFDDTYYEVSQPVDQIKQRLHSVINNETGFKSKPKSVVKLIYRFTAAALILIAAGVIVYFNSGSYRRHQQFSENSRHNIKAGGNKALLTLDNGQTIALNDVSNGIIAKQSSSVASKSNAGTLIYNAAQQAGSTALTYNTISIPRGGQYHVVLADGTKIWLNASSTLKFPVTFSGKERAVELTGEAYFEVVHNAQQPFIVKVNGQQIQDLGTHFDINAYPDERVIKTTLVEGSIKVTSGNSSAILIPGQQAQFDPAGTGKLLIANADVDEAVAWKNGLFQFNKATIESVMRQAARWYNVEVEYPEKLPAKTFTGNISRNTSAAELLKILAYTGLNFKIEGRKFIVLP